MSNNCREKISDVMPGTNRGGRNGPRIKIVTSSDRKGKETGSATRKKRENASLGSSLQENPKKKRKLTLKEENRRKSGFMSGSLLDWAARRQGQSSANLGYTAEQRKHDEVQLENARLVFGSKIKCEGEEHDCPNQLFGVEGMVSKLRDYQVSGAGFMLQRERGRSSYRGGILADDMGMGKTVQAIACMVAHPPSKKAIQEFRSGTLIIVPNQELVKQWTQELWKHAKIPPKAVCKYAGGKMGEFAIRGYPYLLATYSQVERDFRLHESKERNDSKEEDDNGALFQVHFFRIILDEGDIIKNKYGKTSKACGKLKARHKWVLSGTPLRNSIEECLPYFRFLDIDVEELLGTFKTKWGEPKENNMPERTMQILVHIMLRRELGQLFLGREMCKLPKSHIDSLLVSITDEERMVSGYLQEAMLRQEMEVREDDERDLDAPISNHRLRCTRLRQAADHPFLIEESISNFLNQDELDRLIAELERLRSDGSRSSDKSLPLQLNETSILRMLLDIRSHLGDRSSSSEEYGCIECHAKTELQLLECGHVMCRAHYETYIEDEAAQNKKHSKCPKCDRIVAIIKEEPDSTLAVREKPVKPQSMGFRTPYGKRTHDPPANGPGIRSPGDDYNGTQPQMSGSSYHRFRTCDELGGITPSTKTKKAIEIAQYWQEKAPGDKIVIFTEWLGTAGVLGRMLNQAGIKFVYHVGTMSIKARSKSLEDFKSNPVIKIMVSTIATGNVGLNITVANRMIIVNPWWNYATEAQALGRIKRHGQRKETHVVRLFARDTIDERISLLQEKKEAEIQEAMAQGKKPKPLSAEDRLWLETGKWSGPTNPDDSDEDPDENPDKDLEGEPDENSDSDY
ncbi:P-loop containing nucleoside triphosphate hydrolase protein [Xylaria palmicola]|nr:P-loop containing nucleoside triphosphate hydrolase protein [Xylaria palmicola]